MPKMRRKAASPAPRDEAPPIAGAISVASAANAQIKMLKSLHAKKGRAANGLFLAEGARILIEAAQSGRWPEILAFTEEARARPAQADYLNAAQAHGARLIATNAKILASVSGKDNPQALLGAFRPFLTPLSALAPRPRTLALALYEVRDPGNLGTILRTADAVGADVVTLIGRCADPFSLEAVRASMGAVFAVPIARAPFPEFNAWRRAAGLRLLAGSLNASTTPDQADFSGPVALLMGNEQQGLPPAIEAEADQGLRLPMRGRADSLNLAVATGILLYAVWAGRDYAEA